MKSQNLTPEQYRRTNRIMYIILSISYIAFIGIEMSNVSKTATVSGGGIRAAIYAILILALGVVLKLLRDKKAAMVIMAVSYLLAYPLVVFGNGAGTLALAFPVLVGFMIYLNARVILLGCISTFFICAIKSYVAKAAGDTLSYGFANVVTIGLVISILASYWAINSLIRFYKENRE